MQLLAEPVISPDSLLRPVNSLLIRPVFASILFLEQAVICKRDLHFSFNFNALI